MNIREAMKIRNQYYRLTNPSEEDFFLFSEAMDYLIREKKDPNDMVALGSVYYEQKRFDLALKYYEMAAEYGNLYAISNLGYVWYYGRTGERDYEKAFHYFSKAMEMGDLIATYKVADMYKNGYYVTKDTEKYKAMIEALYPKVRNARRLNEPLPEVYTRLARIRTEEGKTEEALQLYFIARDFLAQRITFDPFFGDLNIMKWMISDIYKLMPFDPEVMDLYDLYYVLLRPNTVHFVYENKTYEIESVVEDEACVIRFMDHWYRTVDDFFLKAELHGEHLTTIYESLHNFEVPTWN